MPLGAKKYLTESLWTVDNSVIVWMAGALTAFNAVKLPRLYSNLVNRPKINVLKTDNDISCLGFRMRYKSCHTHL